MGFSYRSLSERFWRNIKKDLFQRLSRMQFSDLCRCLQGVGKLGYHWRQFSPERQERVLREVYAHFNRHNPSNNSINNNKKRKKGLEIGLLLHDWNLLRYSWSYNPEIKEILNHHMLSSSSSSSSSASSSAKETSLYYFPRLIYLLGTGGMVWRQDLSETVQKILLEEMMAYCQQISCKTSNSNETAMHFCNMIYG